MNTSAHSALSPECNKFVIELMNRRTKSDLEEIRLYNSDFLLILILSIVISCSRNSKTESIPSLPDTQENRVAAAKRYLGVITIEEMMKDLTANMAQKFPKEKRQKFIELMTKHLDLKAIEQIMLDSLVLVKHFTVKELEAQTSFYGSPEGKHL